jgi:hypothetical protein
MSSATMYARREGARHFTLRQTRYRPFLEFGTPHPDDVCAVACSLEQLRAMCAGLWPDADYRQAAEEEANAIATARASLGKPRNQPEQRA